MRQDDSGNHQWPQFSSEVMRQGPAIRKAHMTSLVRYLKERHGLQTVNVLEVGSWAGASTITWARAIKDLGLSGSVHCVDIWEPYFDLKANPADIYQKMNRAADHGVVFQEFRRNISAAGVEDIVTFTKGNSREVLPGLDKETYQIIFIDGSHLYDDILNDIVQAKRLVVEGGIVCGDDLELTANFVDPIVHREALAGNLDFTEDPSTGVSYHPGVSQAIADTFGEVSVWDGLWAVRRAGTGFEKLDHLDYKPRIPDHLRVSEKTALTELVRAELGFNIIRSQGMYIGCRQSVGFIDFSIPLDTLTQSHENSDLFVVTSIEDALLRICDLKISELKTAPKTPVAELVDGNLGFNIVQRNGLYAACRQSLGEIDFTVPLEVLSQRNSADDFFVERTREEALLRICEIEKARLNRVIAERRESETSPENAPSV
ncbi:MAG TPA: class I SAM-dependent methyltransferase [Pseudolabrys sp.]|nr:class I SAM-dependent methyltransferase [Pseudolabrys sp.]